MCVIPSGNIKAFIEHFNNIIQSLPLEGSYIMGDFNINLHNPSHHGFHEYQNALLSYNFSPLISISTHNKPGCKSSCIDNIHTNSHENVIVSGIFSERESHTTHLYFNLAMSPMSQTTLRTSMYIIMIFLDPI